MAKRDAIPENIQRALRTVLNYCNVFKAEDEYIRDLDLEESPARIAHMWKHELLASYKPNAYAELLDKFTVFELQKGSPREMIMVKDIRFSSVCAHHMLPFIGTAAVGYIPNKRIAGLSKLARVVEFYSRQLQLHERLTSQIADFLWEHLEPQATMVVVEAEHFCMSLRGVRQPGSRTVLSALRGSVENEPDIKQEFYRLLGRQ